MPDAYTRRARLAPAALAASPAVFLAGGSIVSLEQAGAVVGFILTAASLVLCGLIRGRGRAIQQSLWSEWGGAPTTQMLQWSGPSSVEEVSRRHTLFEIILGEGLPTLEEEEMDAVAADRRYAVAISALRELTRSRDSFPLVAEENAEYGFRRNSLALKPIGIGAVMATILAAFVLALLGMNGANSILALVVALLALSFWTVVVNARWVRSSAELYADRLLEAAESVVQENKQGGRALVGNGGSDG